MNPETWRRVEQLYHSALERKVSERSAFLDDACGHDEALRREVEKLIAGHDQAGTFLDSPAWDLAETVAGPDQTESLVGRTVGAYKVLSSLGSGGMGEVYLAEDTRLGRKIALKLLPARFTQDLDRVRRFEQEVRAASALNHPNIITVHDIGETEAGRFIAMELVAGRTLRATAHDLSLASLVHIGKQIAEALAVAHAAGIVHRDIKPENIMVRGDGYVKVLDFGLARLVSTAVSPRGAREGAFETRPGVLLGTMGYMSPEQARGESVGTATDIFSLGILLYELATGQHPFEADAQISVLHNILSASPLPPTHVNPEISVQVEALILRMLEKGPDRRPAAAAVATALTDELAALAPRESSGGTKVRPEELANPIARGRLGALVMVAFFLAATTGGVLWLVQNRAAGSAPASATGPGEAAATPASPPAAARPRLSNGGPASANQEANRYFETAIQFGSVNADWPRARVMIERALEVDPQFAEARAWYGFTNWLLLDGGYSNDSTLLYQAENEMRRALQDDPGLARAHTGFAAVYLMQGRRELMPAELEQALKSNPDDEDALHFLMHYHHYSGDYAAARRVGQQNLVRLPLFFPTRMILGEMMRQQGDLAGAIREQDRILEQDPQNAYAIRYLARVALDSGDLPKARQTLDRARPADRQTYRTQRSWAILLALEGKGPEALKEMDAQVLKWQALVAHETSEAAEFYAVLGDAPKALDWLDRAVRSGDERAEWFRRDPLLANIRDEPRFQQILESIAYRRQQRTPAR